MTPYTLEIEQSSPGTWVVKVPAKFPLNVNDVNSFVDRTLANLAAVRFVRKNGPAATDKMFNVDEAENALQIEVRTQGEAVPQKITIGGPAGMDGYYARLEPSGRVVVLPKVPWEELLAEQKYFSK